MNIGELDRRIAIEYRATSQDANYGTPIVTWTNLATVWARWDDSAETSSVESAGGGIEVSRNQSRVTIRYRDDVDSSMRFVFGGVAYQIVAGPAVIGRNEFSEFVVERYSSA